MSRSLQVVFRVDVPGVAHAGDVKKVAPGYARNFLLPRDLAFIANDSALRQWETERQGAVARAEHLRNEAKAAAEKLAATPCVITVKAGAEGRLFGSVGRAEIVEVLAKQNVTIDKKQVLLDEPLKQVGDHTVKIQVESGHYAMLKVTLHSDTPIEAAPRENATEEAAAPAE